MDDMKSGLFVNFSYNRTLEQLFPVEESAALGPTILFFRPSLRLKMTSFTITSFLLRSKCIIVHHSLVLFALKMFRDKEVQMQMMDFTKNNSC